MKKCGSHRHWSITTRVLWCLGQLFDANERSLLLYFKTILRTKITYFLAFFSHNITSDLFLISNTIFIFLDHLINTFPNKPANITVENFSFLHLLCIETLLNEKTIWNIFLSLRNIYVLNIFRQPILTHQSTMRSEKCTTAICVPSDLILVVRYV